jgi:hypothetical protein
MRTKGAKNKPKEELKPEVTTTIQEVKPEEQKDIIIKKDMPKPEEKPQETIKQEVQEATATKPKIIKTTVKRLVKKDPVLEIDQNKGTIQTKTIPKKYILVGLVGLGLALAYWKKDAILEKIIEFKGNRILKKIENEGIESLEFKEVKD